MVLQCFEFVFLVLERDECELIVVLVLTEVEIVLLVDLDHDGLELLPGHFECLVGLLGNAVFVVVELLALALVALGEVDPAILDDFLILEVGDVAVKVALDIVPVPVEFAADLLHFLSSQQLLHLYEHARVDFLDHVDLLNMAGFDLLHECLDLGLRCVWGDVVDLHGLVAGGHHVVVHLLLNLVTLLEPPEHSPQLGQNHC